MDRTKTCRGKWSFKLRKSLGINGSDKRVVSAIRAELLIVVLQLTLH